jgi:putative hydrolase of the HAD superfamily
MIIFDYGQTLINEKSFDGLKGTEAVLRVAANNPNNIKAEEIKSFADELNKEMGRYGINSDKLYMFEIHQHSFQNYLYEYFGIEITKSSEEVEHIFQEAAFCTEPTQNIRELLKCIENKGIRTAVISNISFSGSLLSNRISKHIPNHKFEFILASSEYAFRKPHKRIYELALRKAKLDASDVWYCGDNAFCDVDGAASCGIFPVWYKGAMHESNKAVPEKDCLKINHWDELINILESI